MSRSPLTVSATSACAQSARRRCALSTSVHDSPSALKDRSSHTGSIRICSVSPRPWISSVASIPCPATDTDPQRAMALATSLPLRHCSACPPFRLKIRRLALTLASPMRRPSWRHRPMAAMTLPCCSTRRRPRGGAESCPEMFKRHIGRREVLSFRHGSLPRTDRVAYLQRWKAYKSPRTAARSKGATTSASSALLC